MNCVNCGAALPPKSAICEHCRTVNDIDLRGLFDVARRTPDQTRVCPHCELSLESLDLGFERPFFIERCPRCLGLFFDPGELDALVDQRILPPTRIDRLRLQRILDDETPDEFLRVRYVKCPTCGERMNRRTYGARAGVITDECRDHGIWLDSGELRRIMHWTLVGGPLLAEERRAEESRRQERQEHIARLADAHRGSRDTHDDSLDFVDVVSLFGSLFNRMLPRR
jgi:Zn-finger nucleic acid-binding protein